VIPRLLIVSIWRRRRCRSEKLLAILNSQLENLNSARSDRLLLSDLDEGFLREVFRGLVVADHAVYEQKNGSLIALISSR